MLDCVKLIESAVCVASDNVHTVTMLGMAGTAGMRIE